MTNLPRTVFCPGCGETYRATDFERCPRCGSLPVGHFEKAARLAEWEQEANSGHQPERIKE